MYWVTGLLGAFLLVAPMIFGYADNFAALWTSLLVGALVVVLSVFEGMSQDRDAWEYWFAGILGAGIIIAPFVLGFNSHPGAVWSSIITGAIIAVVAFSRVLVGTGQGKI